MSMLRCDKCNRPIDTDFDVDCYYHDSDPDKVMCHICREIHAAPDDSIVGMFATIKRLSDKIIGDKK